MIKNTFAMYQKQSFFDRYFWGTAIFLILFFFLILPFFTWMMSTTQPLNGASVGAFFQKYFHSNKHIDDMVFGLIYCSMFIVFGLLRNHLKLVITPEKIYNTFLNLPIATIVERSSIDYCQMGIVHIEHTRLEKFFNRPLFKSKVTAPQTKLYFFPLRNLQLDLNFEHLNEQHQKQVIDLLRQYYHFQEGVQDIHLSSKEVNTLEQVNIKVSPRIAYLVILSVPLGALGIFLTVYTPFFFFTDYPTFLICSVLLIIFMIPSFVWIRQDIKTFAFGGALIASSFLSMALYACLLPVLHGYYTQHFRQITPYSAKLIESNAQHQVWQPINSDDKFYISPKSMIYNANLQVNQTYTWQARYHWHLYSFDQPAIFQAQKKTAK